jgi:CubicO group peptidase (beta-lactamase class C family)
MPIDATTDNQSNNAALDTRDSGTEEDASTVEVVALEATLEATPGTFPSLSALVFDADSVLAQGAIGVRVAGENDLVTRDDRYHLGSCTKAMTATLAARMVEAGEFSWDTTLAEGFPDLAGTMDPAFRDLTIVDLMTHRAGLSGNLGNDHRTLWSYMWENAGGDQAAVRQHVAQTLLTIPPDGTVGEYLYSNAGFMLAGAMLEAASGRSWQTLMTTEVFSPLHMESCGFGAPGVGQPRGHILMNDVLVPQAVDADNPPGLGPAGTVHCSLEDWAKFGRAHFGGGEFLTQESIDTLHTIPGARREGYALGWVVLQRDWALGDALSHSGSNTMNFAVIWIAPAQQRGVLLATNVAHTDTPAEIDALAFMLIQRFFEF